MTNRLTLLLALCVTGGQALADQGPDLDLPEQEAPVGTLSTSAHTGETTIGGYGELHFSRVMPEQGDTESEIDFHRMVLYLGKKFSDDLQFYSELEIEHAVTGEGKPGEVALEQAYVQYQLSDEHSALGEFGVRAGIVLIPMGIINQWHEPPVFHGVERPTVDKVIIPSTWREGGAGIYGALGPLPELSYELYVVGGLDPLGFSTSKGIRGGRQKAGHARADGLAVAGRLQFLLGTSTVLGLSGYGGLAGRNTDETDADVPVVGVAADVRSKFNGLEWRLVAATFSVGDTEELNALEDMDGNSLVTASDRTFGGYGEVAYNVLRAQGTIQQLLPFARVEYYDTNPDDDAKSVYQAVLGLSYRPIYQVAFKGDYIVRRPMEGDGENVLELGVGFLY